MKSRYLGITFLMILMGISILTHANSHATKAVEDISALKVIVPEQRFIQISKDDWIKRGLLVDDIDQINLWFRGEPYPFWFFYDEKNNPEGIRFYSPSLPKNTTVNENVFMLDRHFNNGERNVFLATEIQENFPNIKPSTVTYNQVFNQQNIYLPQASGTDYWLWELLQPEKYSKFEFNLPGKLQTNPTLKLQIWVASKIKEPRDQTLVLDINGNEKSISFPVAEENLTITVPINSSYVQEKNEIWISVADFKDDIPLKMYLDQVSIDYEHPLLFMDQVQNFSSNSNVLSLPAANTSNTLVIFNDSGLITDNYSIKPGQTAKISIDQGSIFAWIPDGSYFQPKAISALESNNPDFGIPPIHYLMIAPQSFHQSLLPLQQLKEQQSIRTLMVSPEQIYNWMSSGYPSPDAIKTYIQKVFDHNPNELKYVLLVGDYSYEWVNYQKYLQFVPTFFVDSSLTGQSISDFPYTDMNDDLIPDLMIGRVPANSIQQLDIYIQKLTQYEENLPNDWRNIMALLDPSDPLFIDSGNGFLSSFPQSQTTIPPGKSFDDARNIFGQPYSLLLYFGHGSIDRWGQEKILSTTKLSSLPVNSAPLVILSLSCLNGYFIHTEKVSLAESLLFYPGGGVIVIYAPIGQTMIEDQEKLLQFLQNKLQSEDNSRMGNLFFPLEGENYSYKFSVAVIQQSFIYFGDPAMRIPQPVHQFSQEGGK